MSAQSSRPTHESALLPLVSADMGTSTSQDDERTQALADLARAEMLYRDALRIRDWAVGTAAENGHLLWEINKLTRDFDSAVEDVRYHAARGDELAGEIQKLRSSPSWKLGRAITLIPRKLRLLGSNR